MGHMKIALVGNQSSIEKIRKTFDPEMQFVDMDDFPCTWETVAPTLEKVQKAYDAVLFTGVRYYFHACRQISPSIPWGYPKRSISAVLCTLLKAQRAGADIANITFDMYDLTASKLKALLCDKVGLPLKDVSIYCYNDLPQVQNYYNGTDLLYDYTEAACAYHLDNLKNKRAGICLSASVGIAQHSKLRPYPVFLVPLTADDIHEAINNLRIQHQVHEQQNRAGFSVAAILLSVRMAEMYNGSVQEIRQMHTMHQIETDVYSYAQNIGAVVEKQTKTDFLLYTTQAELYAVTEHFAKFDLAQRLEYLPDVTFVSIGIGFGLNHRIAKSNAQSSVQCAQNQKYNCYYITDESGGQSGPFVFGQAKHEREIKEIQLERISSETGVGTAVLISLIKAQAQYNFKNVTSDRLAEVCNLTLSSMNRIVAKLIQAGYAEIVGIQPQNGAGRPKRLIRLKLPAL